MTVDASYDVACLHLVKGDFVSLVKKNLGPVEFFVKELQSSLKHLHGNQWNLLSASTEKTTYIR